MNVEKYIGESILSDKPRKKLSLVIKDGSVTNSKLAGNAITIDKIAEEIWNKLKNEYLRLDGTNNMKGNFNLGGKSLTNVGTLYTGEVMGTGSLPASVKFTGGKIIFGYYDVDGSTDATFQETGSIDQGDMTTTGNITTTGNMQADGFLTTTRSSLGLLNNNGEVILSMTDTEVDNAITKVFS
jgi:hypothetical protein